jgi:soluble lytic murein transglycosylase-like protein
MISVLFINDVPIKCINQAATQYHVSAYVIASILRVENGRVGMATLNKNGTYDYGPMQINSIWMDKLSQYGITKDQVQYNPCTNVWVGAWILSQKLAQEKDYWHGVGTYHSYTSPQNSRYQQKVAATYYNLISYFSQSR